MKSFWNREFYGVRDGVFDIFVYMRELFVFGI